MNRNIIAKELVKIARNLVAEEIKVKNVKEAISFLRSNRIKVMKSRYTEGQKGYVTVDGNNYYEAVSALGGMGLRIGGK